MSLLRTGLTRLIAAVFALITLTSAALATCSELVDMTPDKLMPSTIEEVQRGLRSVFRDSNGLLRDGQLGPYTRTTLAKLCEVVPRPEGLDDIRSTLQLAEQYAKLDVAWPTWAKDLYDLDLTAVGDTEAAQMLAVRLAGNTEMKSLAIGRRALIYDCADPGGALADYPNGARALATLTRLFRDRSEVELCNLLPVAGNVSNWQQAMERLGQISGSRVGALQVLTTPAFLDWVEDNKEARLRRLAGTMPAVLTLIDDYNNQNADGTGATSYSGGPCSPEPIERTLTYYSLTEADIGSLDFLVSLSPKLEAFAAEYPGAGSPQALWRDLRPILAEYLDDCILAEIETLVTGPEQLPLAFQLKPAATERLMAQASLETAVPVLTELAPVRTSTKAELVNRIKAGLQAVQGEIVGAEVAAAADTLAAASEPVTPPTDTPVMELELEEEPTTAITVTDASDQAVETAINNPELADALRNTPMADASVPELIRSQARAALEETAARQAQRIVEQQIMLIEPAVSSQWALTEALQAEILAVPYVRATIADATADGVVDRLAPIAGVSYPSHRLFDEALRTVSMEDGMVPFSQFVTERIEQTAQNTIDDAHVTRQFGPFEIKDCDCVPERQTEDLQVYGFYPFWLAPSPPSRIKAAAAQEGTEEETAPQVQTRIDFGTVDQIAFYGLEFSPDQNGQPALQNRDQWRAAKRQFVNSAHQYRAKADLAFDLREWMDWDSATIDDVVEDIATEMAPFERLEGFEFHQIGQAIPTLFDPAQPDGVTLIFHDYQGVGLGRDQMANMVRIIKTVYEALPNRDRLRINVAFDFPLVDQELDQPVFDELYELLFPNPYVLANEDPDADGAVPDDLDRETTKVINKILLFLERPTTAAKKGLRYRMEQGLFQGEVRRQVLRSIIPVLPPSGHELIRTSIKPNDPDQSERLPFSQFEDDVVYFKDNFSGIGFWPILDPLGTETEALATIIADHFNAPLMPPILASFTEPVAQVCSYACPNRAKVSLAVIALFLIVILLTWRSFYSGLVDKIAFRFMAIGLVWIGNLTLLGLLFVLANCDPHSYLHDMLMWMLIAVLGLLLIYNFIQRIKNGPMP